MSNHEKNQQKEFFAILEEAQKEYEDLHQINCLSDIVTETEVEDYSQRNFSHPVDLVIM